MCYVATRFIYSSVHAITCPMKRKYIRKTENEPG